MQLNWIATPEELIVRKPRKVCLHEDESLTEVPCHKCRIEGRDGIVPGQGAPGRAMFIGINPGKHEAEKGRPFVGTSGQFLRRVLSDVGFLESDCYFSNVVHCRLLDEKGDNRLPNIKEMKICGPFIWQEIREKNPSLIIILGDLPIKYFLNKDAVAKYRGMVFKKAGRTFFVAHHPSHINRLPQNDKERKLFKQDMSCAYKILYGVKDEKVGVEKIFCDTQEKVLDALETVEERKFVLDIETDAPGKAKERKALDPWATGFKITFMGFATRIEDGTKKAFSIPLEVDGSPLNFDETFPVLKNFLENGDLQIRGQNLKWDFKCLKVHFNININSVDFDTLPAHPLLEGKVSHSLERMSIDYLDSGSYKSILRDGRLIKDIPMNEVADMNMEDCLNNLELAEIFERELEKTNQLEYYSNTVVRAIPVFKNMEVRGVKVDTDYLEELKKQLEDGIATSLEKLKSYEQISGEDWGKPFEKVLASNKDLNTILFSKFGFTPPKERKNVFGYSVDKQVLKELEIKYQDPFIKDLLEWKGLVKKLNTYVAPYHEKGHIKSDGKIHGNIRQDITLTGRLSMEKPNLQNIPVKDGSDILRLFISSYPGGKIILADYCLHPDTNVECLGGKKTIKEIVDLVNKNKDVWVYSYRFDKKRMGLSKVIAGAKTGVNKEVWEVGLDNGESVIGTPEHKFMMRDGSYKELQNLRVGDRLMPFYERHKSFGGQAVYRQIRGNSQKYSWKYIDEHKLVVLDVIGYDETYLKGKSIHHKDGCGINNFPENLQIMTQNDHYSFHRSNESLDTKLRAERGKWTQSETGREFLSNNTKLHWNCLGAEERKWRGNKISLSKIGKCKGSRNPNYKDKILWKCSYCNKEKMVIPFQSKKKYCNQSCFHKSRIGIHRKFNHKVVFLRKFGFSDVYNITVEGCHNFALSSGVIAKNSQIELRVMAAASRDRKMLEAFMQNRDIHLDTAANVNRLTYADALCRYEAKDAQIKKMRYDAKAVNFGIIYGMAEMGLAEQLGWYTGEGVKRKLDIIRAKIFIDEYLEIYGGVKEYMDKTKKDWKANGYVETLFGRRIIIKSSNNPKFRSKNERRAVNAPIQGTASDICVMALIELSERLERVGLSTVPILTIHDALAFDTPPEETGVGEIIKEIMEDFEYPWMLGIPLKVDVSMGNNLAEAKG